jgi:hypothetical protein
VFLFVVWIFTWHVCSSWCPVHWSGTCINSFYSWMDTYVKHLSPKFHMYTSMSRYSLQWIIFSKISCLSSYLNTLFIPQWPVCILSILYSCVLNNIFPMALYNIHTLCLWLFNYTFNFFYDYILHDLSFFPWFHFCNICQFGAAIARIWGIHATFCCNQCCT